MLQCLMSLQVHQSTCIVEVKASEMIARFELNTLSNDL